MTPVEYLIAVYYLLKILRMLLTFGSDRKKKG